MWNTIKKDWWIPGIYLLLSLLSLMMTVQYDLLHRYVAIPPWYKILIGVLGMYQFSSGSIFVWAVIYLPFINWMAKRWGLRDFAGILILTQGLWVILGSLLFFPYIQYLGIYNRSMVVHRIWYNVLYSFIIYVLVAGKTLLTKYTRPK